MPPESSRFSKPTVPVPVPQSHGLRQNCYEKVWCIPIETGDAEYTDENEPAVLPPRASEHRARARGTARPG